MCDDMMELHKRMFPDSEIAAAMALKRKKCTTLVQQLGDFVGGRLASKLKENKFSIIIDESTDCSVEKACAIIVKYFDKATNMIKTAMLDIVNVYDGQEGGSSGEALFNKIIHCLNSYEIPLNNLIGFAADGASNMMGAFNSVTSRLKHDIPGISILRCVSHSIHLCSSEAAKTLPRSCEDLVRNIYNFFAHSAKRKFEFKEYQMFCKVKPHKILHPCATRWLSLHNAVARILEQWHPLKLYFRNIVLEERLSSIEKINESLNDPSILCYLTFLNYILPHLNSVNVLFQSRGPTLHLLNDKLCNLYRLLLDCFCYSHAIAKSPLHDIDPSDNSKHKPVEQIYLGAELHVLFQRPEYQRGNIIVTIKTRCRVFLIEACKQIRKRFDLNNSLWRLASYLHPKKFLDHNIRSTMPSLSDLVREVPRINTYSIQTLDDQWRDIAWHHFPDNIKELQGNAQIFFKFISEYEDDDGSRKYQCLANFALEVLSLPSSNADAERLFSKYNLIKRKERNALKLETVRALINVSECAKNAVGDEKFTPDREMVLALRH